MSNPVKITYRLAAAVTNGIAQSQSLGAAGNLTLNGSLVSGGVATLDSGGAARRVLITSAADDSGMTWTLTGTDRNGVAQSEVFAGGAGVAVYSAFDYLTVTRVRGSAATAGAVTAGTNGVGSTQWFQRDWVNISVLGVLAYVGTGKVVTYNVEGTMDDPNAPLDVPPYNASVEHTSFSPPNAVPFPGWSALSGSNMGEITIPVFMYRLTITAGTDPVTMQVIESTPWSSRNAL